MGALQHVKAAADVPEVKAEIEPYTYGPFTFSVTGLTVKGKPTFDEWQDVGRMLAIQVRGLQFMVGDWLRIGEDAFGELAAQAIDAREWSESTVRVYRHVASKIPPQNRMLDRGLDYSHHQAVAALSEPEQRKWLKRALGDGEGPWPVSRLRQEIRAASDERELVETGWFIVVRCDSSGKRDKLMSELQSQGYSCRAETKREPR